MASTAEQTEKPAGNTPYYRLGGRETIQRICNRFYDLMEQDPAYAELRAMHAPDLSMMRHSLTGFLSAWSGGPRDWFHENPGKCMMSAHKPFTIGKGVAGQWAEAMRRAINDSVTDDPEIAKAMAGVLEEMALGMARD